MENEKIEEKLPDSAETSVTPKIPELSTITETPEVINSPVDFSEPPVDKNPDFDEIGTFDQSKGPGFYSEKELKLIRKIERERSRRMNRKEQTDSFLTKFIIIVVSLCFLSAVAIFGIVYISKQNTGETTSYQMTVLSTLESCQELVTYKYHYKQVDFIKHASSKTNKNSSYVLLEYSGIIRAGIGDLSKCVYEISEDGKHLKVKTPEITILGNDIDKYEVLDEYQKTFSILPVKDTMRELDKRKRKLENDAIEEGLLNNAAEHAKMTLENVFLAAGFESVEVEYPEVIIDDYIVDEAFEVTEAH